MTTPNFPASPDGAPFTGHSRDRILRAASAAFSQRGFHGVTVRDLAQQAQVNVAAINYHFRSKDELYAAVIDFALAQWLAETIALEDLPANSPLPKVLHLIASALIAPVIDRDDAPLLSRLIAWDLLQEHGQGRAGSSPAVIEVIRNRLQPHLPTSLVADDLELVSSWLVSQCLLLSPALRQPKPGLRADLNHSQALADRISALALHGLAGLLNPARRDGREAGFPPAST